MLSGGCFTLAPPKQKALSKATRIVANKEAVPKVLDLQAPLLHMGLREKLLTTNSGSRVKPGTLSTRSKEWYEISR